MNYLFDEDKKHRNIKDEVLRTIFNIYNSYL